MEEFFSGFHGLVTMGELTNQGVFERLGKGVDEIVRELYRRFPFERGWGDERDIC